VTHDSSHPAIHDFDLEPVSKRDELFDKIDAIERRLDSFMVEMREWAKDIRTVINVHHGRGLDTEERVTAVERDIVAITAALPKRKKRK
jgi:hypothetical protein